MSPPRVPSSDVRMEASDEASKLAVWQSAGALAATLVVGLVFLLLFLAALLISGGPL